MLSIKKKLLGTQHKYILGVIRSNKNRLFDNFSIVRDVI